MKIGVDYGHNCYPNNTGATGIRTEDEVIIEVGTLVTDKLKKLGHEVILLKPEGNYIGNTLLQRVQKANENNVELVLSIHFNFGGGMGTEAYAISSTGKEYAQKIIDEIEKLGYVNRGVKDGSNLYIVSNTNAPTFLVEVCFVDSIEDMNRYNAEDLATAIVKGITGETVSEIETDKLNIKYQGHVENIGWQDWVWAGTDKFAGTVGQGLRLEALVVNLENSNGTIVIQGHIQNRGWQSIRNDGEPIGTIGKSLRLEAIKLKAEGITEYSISYRVHIENDGWTAWSKDGDVSGTIGESKRIEAVQIQLMKA
jgi:N-acetylmuramoyl-L-alanine amidase